MSVKSLLICNSNMFVPTVLTEVLAHIESQYIVISDTKNICKLFEFLNIPNVIFHEYGVKGRFDFYRAKKELYDFVTLYDIGKVVFFHTEFGGMANWLICKLSKRIQIYFCKIYDPLPLSRAPWSLRVLKIHIKEYLYWGQRVEVLQKGYPFPSLPRSFYEGIHSKTITMPVDQKLISQTVADKLNTEDVNAHILLLTGTVVDMGYVEEPVYKEIVDRLISELGAQNIASKCHPRFSNLYGLEATLKQVPSFIPGNLMLDAYDCVIGYESTLLVEAAKAGKTAISLLEMIPPIRHSTIGQIKTLFSSRLEGMGEILFPKNMEELKGNVSF